MEAYTFFVGVVGNVISVLLFLSPIATFWRIIKHKSTEEFESLPYVCTLLSSSLWTYYGLIREGEFLVATVNGFGVVVEAIYVILFLIFAPPKMKVKTAALVGILDIGFLVATIAVARLALNWTTQIDAIGFVCAGLNIIMYGSPLAAMRTVVTTRSVEYMPFCLSFFVFLNGGVWTVYALLVHDFFLMVPNGAGFLLGIAQLILYAIYRNARPKPNQSTSRWSGHCEEGSKYEHLIPSSSQQV